MNPAIKHTFIHDLESAFYVVFWLSIKFLANSWSPERRSLVMNNLFNPVAFATVGASSKRNWMAQGRAETLDFKVIGNEFLTGLIISLVSFFQARHMQIIDQPPTHLNFGPREPDIPMGRDAIEVYLRSNLADHKVVIATFRSSLNPEMRWPEVEPATKQNIYYPSKEERSSSKRSKSYYGKDMGSSQKRLRTK